MLNSIEIQIDINQAAQYFFTSLTREGRKEEKRNKKEKKETTVNDYPQHATVKFSNTPLLYKPC